MNLSPAAVNLTPATLSDLRPLFAMPAPLSSVYHRLPDPAGKADDEIRLRTALDEAQERGCAPNVQVCLEQELAALVPGHGAAALFVGVDGQAMRVDMDGADVADQVWQASVPRLVPFLEWWQYRPPHVVGSSAEGFGVQGVGDTLQALAEGQVDTLLLAAGEVGGVAWFGPDATDVAERRSEARDQEGVRSGPLSDVLVRAAILTGAEVRILPAGLVDVPREGVGALLRAR